MLLVTAEDPLLGERVCESLTRGGLAHRRVDPEEATAVRGTLFQIAFDARATGIVVLEPAPWKGQGGEPKAGSDALLDAALSATNAMNTSLLVLCTQRADDDAGLRKLKRKGAPYIVLRPAPLYDVQPSGFEARVRERSVLLPPEVIAATEGAIPASLVVEAVLAALRGAIPQGRVEDLLPSKERSLREVLVQAGAKPKDVKAWRSRVGRWFGQAVARVAEDGVHIDGLAAASPTEPVLSPAAA